MDTFLIAPLIEFLQSLSAEGVSLILFGVCTASMLILLRLFGVNGLYVYNIVAILTANIQVLKGAQFTFLSEPVALGTVVFATTYLCSDIIVEHYGKGVAKVGVWLSFSSQILLTVLMVVALGYAPLSQSNLGAGTEHMSFTHQAMAWLFTPSPRLLFASLLAFAISQFNDIWLFQTISKLTHRRWLWLRTTIATLVSAFVDTVIFSVLAWMVLAPKPVGLSTLVFTYILGTYVTRALVSVLSTPIMYLSYVFLPNRLF
jgi:uncharacterized integral membrane protein (TIGR00697 family)